MKPIESLKARLSNDKLLVQNEKGFLSTVGFEWNPAATDKEIAEFETVLHHQLPAEFKEFLKISNGATFFKDLDYGQWGFHILSLAELSEIQSKVTTRGYCKFQSNGAPVPEERCAHSNANGVAVPFQTA